MALRNSTSNAAPAFESMDDDTLVAEATVIEKEPEMTAPTAVAAPAPTAVAAPSTGKFKAALGEYMNVISTQDLEAMGASVFPRITADLGGLIQDRKEELGKVVKVELLSWNLRHVITTGTMDSEANEKVRMSYDGVHINGTADLVSDYINALKAEGYDNACSKLYGDLWVTVLATNKGELAVEDQYMAQVQLSPQSLAKFKGFQLEQGIKEARGVPKSPVLVIRAEAKTIGQNRFGLMTFASK